MKKPILLVPPGFISHGDKKKLEENLVCVITAKDPSKLKFVEPPVMFSDVRERAAIELSRYLLTNNFACLGTGDITKKFTEYIIKGSSLDRLKI